jgi:hypothetical protein
LGALMEVSLTQFTLVDFCDALKRGDIEVNRHYQRNPSVWPEAARSFLIETILLGYPIPKLYLSQITDVKTRTTRKEIVDGQQRSMAIWDYYENKFPLTRTTMPPEAAGRKYEELDEDLKQRFISYRLSADLLIGVTPDDIREIFRRMNSYTVPLNAEERRHSKFQGEFKWFAYRVTKRYSQSLEDMRAFTEKALARMADTKLVSELCHAITWGIKTTSDKELSRLYREYDRDFPQQSLLEHQLAGALDAVIGYRELYGSALVKPYQLYALLLALIHFHDPVQSLREVYAIEKTRPLGRARVIENLTRLAAVLEDPDNAQGDYREFIEASESKTNVAKQRQTRFRWYCRALSDSLP